MKRLSTIMFCMVLLMLASCNKGLDKRTGLRGTICGDDKMTIEGDTFGISEQINDSMLIICSYPEWDAPYYLIKQNKRNSMYYVLLEANYISTIGNTADFINIDNNSVYDLAKKKTIPIPCDMEYLSYLGSWKEKPIFANMDTICFSDGKCVALQEDVIYQDVASDTGIIFIKGAQTFEMTFDELYHLKPHPVAKDNSIVRLKKNYYVPTIYVGESDDLGFSVDLDVPKGNTQADKAIREWMTNAVKDDAFDMLECPANIYASKGTTIQDVKSALDSYGKLWEKLCTSNYLRNDTLDVRITGSISTRKIVDCSDYTTYYYSASIYTGGMHEMPRSYYITYDKKRQILLTASNTIKPSKLKQFRLVALNHLKSIRDEYYGEESTLEDFADQAFSFHEPPIGIDTLADVLKPFLIHEYMCDAWSEWESAGTAAFSMDNFPLPHFALLPEGIVITYHPYQIDCFAAGEYHAIIPYKEVRSYLQYDYHEMPQLCPKWYQFVKL